MTWIDQASLPLPTPEDNVTDLQQALSVLGEEQVYSDWPVGAEGMLVPWLMKLSIQKSVRILGSWSKGTDLAESGMVPSTPTGREINFTAWMHMFLML